MKNNGLKIFYSIVTLLWLGIIFWSSAISDYSSVPGQADSQSDFLSSIVHLIMYAILCFLFIKLFMSYGLEKKKSIAYGFLAAIVYGLIDEFHQFFVPDREMHFGDWLLDAVGAFVVVCLYNVAGRMPLAFKPGDEGQCE